MMGSELIEEGARRSRGTLSITSLPTVKCYVSRMVSPLRTIRFLASSNVPPNARQTSIRTAISLATSCVSIYTDLVRRFPIPNASTSGFMAHVAK